MNLKARAAQYKQKIQLQHQSNSPFINEAIGVSNRWLMMDGGVKVATVNLKSYTTDLANNNQEANQLNFVSYIQCYDDSQIWFAVCIKDNLNALNELLLRFKEAAADPDKSNKNIHLYLIDEKT